MFQWEKDQQEEVKQEVPEAPKTAKTEDDTFGGALIEINGKPCCNLTQTHFTYF